MPNFTRLSEADLKGNIGNRVLVTFLARDVQLRTQKDQITKYIVFNMVDKDLVVEARIFGATDEQIKLVQEGVVYNAAIDVKPYDKSTTGYSCIIYNMDYSDIAPELFANWATDIEKARNVINSMLNKYYNTYYGKIAATLIIKYWEKFSKWSAAKSLHHNILGGLLSHTADAVVIADILADHFNKEYGPDFINKPLLISATLLHDLGKIFELDVDVLSGKTEYSTHASLSNHIMDILKEVDLQAHELGYGASVTIDSTTGNIVGDKSLEQRNAEAEAVDLLKHCLAAHHGKLEFGSPITASIPEATLIYLADNISAEMFKYCRDLKQMEPGESKVIWSGGGSTTLYREKSKLLIGDIENE
ncbi:MAG: hypothetical protein IJ593_03130 [Lachnospiraceae bacterium]|nr:hypothetical protein [Lachnospiraceae bacterium]